MNDQDLRALVREAVSRHLGNRDAGMSSGSVFGEPQQKRLPRPSPDGHASHAVYINLVNVDESCVIEPSVACSHCNYCRSHGH